MKYKPAGKITLEKLDNIVAKESTKSEIQALQAAISLSEYYHKKYVNNLQDKLAKLQNDLMDLSSNQQPQKDERGAE